FREIARHILDVGHVLTGVLLDGIDNLATPEFRHMRQKYIFPLPADAQPDAMASALEQSLSTRIAELEAKSPEFYALEITRFDGQQVTRLELLQFAKEHELTHRSQLFMLLRLKGIVPATTRRRRAAQAKA
ncbi:MAG: DinB family protein, partial [Acidobacteriota bacterium]|nr:DinB family protein [Acidobacteriota bacterium]